MDNDQPNIQPLIPASATVDLKLSGEYDRYFWSLSVNNVFNVLYYDYSVASAFTPTGKRAIRELITRALMPGSRTSRPASPARIGSTRAR